MTPRDRRIKAALDTWATAAPLRSHRAMEGLSALVFAVALVFQASGESIASRAGFVFGLLLLNLSLCNRIAPKWVDQSLSDFVLEVERTSYSFVLVISALLLVNEGLHLVFALCGFDQ